MALLIALAAATCAASHQADWSPWWLVVALAALACVAELARSRRPPPHGSLDVSGSTIAICCALVLLGAAPGAAIAAGAIAVEGLNRRKPVGDLLSNVVNYATFSLAGGLLAQTLVQPRGISIVGGIFVFALYLVCDLMNFGLAVAWQCHRDAGPHRLRPFVDVFFRAAPSVLVSGLIAVFAVWTYESAGGRALVLIGAGLLVAEMLLTRLSAVEFQLRTERDRAQSYLDAAGSPFIVLSEARRIERVNRRAEELLGAAEGHLTGEKFDELLRPEERKHFVAAFGHAAAGRDARREAHLRRTDSSDRVVLWSVAQLKTGHGSPQFLLSGEDITERRQAEERLEQLAFHDPLTELPNRAAFAAELRQRVLRVGQEGGAVGVAFIDLDGFKAINDGFGHAIGDDVLRHVARRLQNGLRRGDMVARQSGDEFLLLLDDLPEDPAAARVLCETVLARTRTDLSAPYAIGGASLTIGASAGVALHPTDSGDPEALIAIADREMYTRKPTGATPLASR